MQTEWINWKLHTKLSDMVIKCWCRGSAVAMDCKQSESNAMSMRAQVCWCVLSVQYSSCITHMYRLQMHSRYASPSLCINTITHLMHTFAAAMPFIPVVLFCFVCFLSYRHCSCAFNCIFEFMYMMLIRLHQIVWCFSAHWIEQPIEQNNNSHHNGIRERDREKEKKEIYCEEDECLTWIWSFLQRLNMRLNNNNNRVLLFLFMKMREEKKMHTHYTYWHMFWLQLHTVHNGIAEHCEMNTAT